MQKKWPTFETPTFKPAEGGLFLDLPTAVTLFSGLGSSSKAVASA